jgi:hypothetical protein
MDGGEQLGRCLSFLDSGATEEEEGEEEEEADKKKTIASRSFEVEYFLSSL